MTFKQAAVVGVVLGMAFVSCTPAQAHTQQAGGPGTYKGHSCYYWAVSIPNGQIHFRECYAWGYTQGGVHYHDYATDSYAGPSCCPYKLVHWHYGRVVPGHPV